MIIIIIGYLPVPSAPADIKAVVSSRNKILVSWLPPSSPNGVLVGYTLYMSVIEDGREVRDTNNNTPTIFKLVRVQYNCFVQFCIKCRYFFFGRWVGT